MFLEILNFNNSSLTRKTIKSYLRNLKIFNFYRIYLDFNDGDSFVIFENDS
jgi:hypothetical protein